MSTTSFKYISTNLNYKHGFLQTMFMFLGELINLFLYGLYLLPPSRRLTHLTNLKSQADLTNLSFQFSKFWMGLSSLCDASKNFVFPIKKKLVGSSLQIPAILLMPASINQMLCGGIIVSTCILSRLILKNPIERHHALGCC
jgi:hypothetical protein